jgi:O-acetyl-ADP-ribose deacetylase (regulator of RNase III)
MSAKEIEISTSALIDKRAHAERGRGTKIVIKMGNITQERVDAIVNAANDSLMGGGGVDGAIHMAAGWQELEAECAKLGGCDIGDAKITRGHKLPAKYIIHAVGPVYEDGEHGEPKLLASCYRRSLEVAVENGVKTIAFPAISTGIFHYPKEDAARVVRQTIVEFLQTNTSLTEIRFIMFTPEDFAVYKKVFKGK